MIKNLSNFFWYSEQLYQTTGPNRFDFEKDVSKILKRKILIEETLSLSVQLIQAFKSVSVVIWSYSSHTHTEKEDKTTKKDELTKLIINFFLFEQVVIAGKWCLSF